LFRLAGNHEYTQGRVPGYLQAINRHFEAHRDHEEDVPLKHVPIRLVVNESSFSHRKDAEAAEATRRKPLRISLRPLWVLCASAVKTALQHASSV
jgi:hypothetical protein